MLYIKKYLYLLLLSCNNLNSPASPTNNFIKSNLIPPVSSVNYDLQVQKFIALSRITFASVLALGGLCLYKNNIKNFVNEFPIISAAILYFFYNCTTDMIFKYYFVNQTIKSYVLLQNISLYLLCLLGIHNTIQEKATQNNSTFDTDVFFKNITDHIGYSFEDLELFTFDSLTNLIKSINNLCCKPNSTGMEDKIYILCKKNITIEHLLSLVQNNPHLHRILFAFYLHPEEQENATINQLCTLIKNDLQYLIRKNFTFSSQYV